MSESASLTFGRQRCDCKVRPPSNVSPSVVPLGILVVSFLFRVTACTDRADDPDARDPVPESPRESLGPPTAVFAEEFGYLHSVRELPNGDILVVDLFDKAVYRVDMETQTRTMVGGRGEGPDEYLGPDAVWPLPGDSTLLVDVGNGRLVRIGPDLAFGSTRSLTVRPEAGSVVLTVPHGVDSRGNIYTTPEPWPPTGADSATILRIDPVRETVDSLWTIRTRWAGPLMPHDAWGVAADGSVVVARAHAYGVDWISPEGSVVRGDTVPHDPVPVTIAEKAEYYRDLQRTLPGHSQCGHRFRRRTFHSLQTQPRFGAGTVTTSPGGRTCCRPSTTRPSGSIRWTVPGCTATTRPAATARTTSSTARDGSRCGLWLQATERVVGFGAEAVYIAAFDDLDRVFLERYRVPRQLMRRHPFEIQLVHVQRRESPPFGTWAGMEMWVAGEQRRGRHRIPVRPHLLPRLPYRGRRRSALDPHQRGRPQRDPPVFRWTARSCASSGERPIRCASPTGRTVAWMETMYAFGEMMGEPVPPGIFDGMPAQGDVSAGGPVLRAPAGWMKEMFLTIRRDEFGVERVEGYRIRPKRQIRTRPPGDSRSRPRVGCRRGGGPAGPRAAPAASGEDRKSPEWQGFGSKPHHCSPAAHTRAVPAIQAKTVRIPLELRPDPHRSPRIGDLDASPAIYPRSRAKRFPSRSKRSEESSHKLRKTLRNGGSGDRIRLQSAPIRNLGAGVASVVASVPRRPVAARTRNRGGESFRAAVLD